MAERPAGHHHPVGECVLLLNIQFQWLRRSSVDVGGLLSAEARPIGASGRQLLERGGVRREEHPGARGPQDVRTRQGNPYRRASPRGYRRAIGRVCQANIARGGRGGCQLGHPHGRGGMP